MGWISTRRLDDEQRLDRKAAAQVVRRALHHLRPYRAEMFSGSW